jgi:tRNA (mo5U34)-methyltransferase
MQRKASVSRIREDGLRLAPWHLQVEITPELSTRDLCEAAHDEALQSFIDPRSYVKSILARLYPEGLQGRTALDCACNNGAYLFVAKEAGAGRCFGFDARDHWIEQARFLVEHREGPSDDMHFETCDLYDLLERDVEPCDFTICSGVLYHLPDPIRALETMAQLTREVMLLTSATVPGWRDGALVAAEESKTAALSGKYGLNWFPTGPAAATSILWWLGFDDVGCWNWFPQASIPNSPELDRFILLAFREGAALEAWHANGPRDELGRMRERVVGIVPPRATVLVATQGRERFLDALARPAWHFPQNGAGAHVPITDSRALMVQLDELRARNADYLVIPRSSVSWLDGLPDFRQYLQRRYRAIAGEPERDGCMIYDLAEKDAFAPGGYFPNFDYFRLVRQIRELVGTIAPSGSIVLVVSRGDDDLLKLDGSQGWHFPRNEQGGYLGHYPPDSATATAHLEELRAKGAEYLVIPRTAFWWLDHYAEFGEHLESRYPVLLRDDGTCMIFGLAERDAVEPS